MTHVFALSHRRLRVANCFSTHCTSKATLEESVNLLCHPWSFIMCLSFGWQLVKVNSVFLSDLKVWSVWLIDSCVIWISVSNGAIDLHWLLLMLLQDVCLFYTSSQFTACAVMCTVIQSRNFSSMGPSVSVCSVMKRFTRDYCAMSYLKLKDFLFPILIWACSFVS